MPSKQHPAIITPQILKYFQRGFTFGQICRVHPYVWNPEVGFPSVRRGVLNILWWYLNILVTWIYTAFVIGRCIQKNVDPNATVGVQTYLQFTVVYYSFPSLFHLTFVLMKAEVLNLALQTQMFMHWIERTMDFDARHFMRRCYLCMAFTFYGFIMISIFVTVYAFLKPDSPEMISSVIRDRSFLTRVACGVFQGYIEYMFHSQCFLIIFILFGSVFPCWVLLSEIRLWVYENFWQRASRYHHIYNTIRLLTRIVSDVFMGLTVPYSKFMLISLVIFCTYSAVRLGGFLSLSLGTMGLVLTAFLVILFGTLAEVFELSTKMKADAQSAGHYGRKNIVGKMFRSMPTIKFWMGSNYYVDKMLVLTILNTIVQSSISFLVARPHD